MYYSYVDAASPKVTTRENSRPALAIKHPVDAGISCITGKRPSCPSKAYQSAFLGKSSKNIIYSLFDGYRLISFWCLLSVSSALCTLDV